LFFGGFILAGVGNHCEEGTFLVFRYLMDTVDHQAESCFEPDTAPSQVERYLRGCPVRTVLEMFANKWTVLVMVTVYRHDGPIRFNGLRRELDGVTQKMLTQTLRMLEREGLIRRDVYPTVPPRVEYSLTELGLGAARVLADVGRWSAENIDRILSSRAEFDDRAGRVPLPVKP
jgi:DNA-binding HxlR family transcriptional regulator